ncbi:MAG: hypothetical protein QM767_26565 [Anaeromyxobacter sp.]
MSDLPHDSVHYQAVVAEYFLALRGTGLLLSPLDQELVAGWERRGLPVAVVCRGMKRGAEELAAARRGPPRSLRAVRLAVEDEWRAYRSARVGESPAPPGEAGAARERLGHALRLLAGAAQTAPEALAGSYVAAQRVLEGATALPGSPLEQLERALAAADARLLAGWVGALPRAERAALGPQLRALTGARRRGESRRAHREALRAHLSDLARRAGLTCLRGSV